MKNMMNRLRQSRGESLVESLVTLLIISIAALMIAGSIVSAARTNAGARKIVTFPSYSDGKDASVTLTWDDAGYSETGIPVTMYTDAKDMVYYEIKK